MFKKVLKTELLIETIVTCPKCHKQNRLFKRVDKSIYRCSICQHQLSNPFWTPHQKRQLWQLVPQWLKQKLRSLINGLRGCDRTFQSPLN